MLAPDGKHVCIIPFLSCKYDECFQDISNEERTRRFGQFDHVRRFGRNDAHAHLGKIIELPATVDLTAIFSENELLGANIPESHWYGFTIGTVLELAKDDYKLHV
jgi:phosphoglycolate phosphatase